MQRRVFLRSGALALVTMGLSPSFLRRAVYAQLLPRARKGKVLICLFQRGAADGLNIVVPHGDPHYYALRPDIAIARPGDPGGGAIDLDGFFGLHPAMSPLKPLWDRGLLAPVHAVGSPSATRSHFDAQDFMESGTPDVKGTPDGWLNRFLATRGTCAEREVRESPFRAVAFAAQTPRIFEGPAPTIAMSSPDAVKMLKSANPQRYAAEHGAAYPDSPFAQRLRQIAQLVKSDVGLEIAFADVGGWDTHVNQGGATGQLANRLDDFSKSIAALVTDLGDRMDDVMIMTMSEFGRMAKQNGSGGTDHGHAGALFVIGGQVQGHKVHGKWPGLAREQLHEGRDLAITTDFRAVFAEVVSKHLGATRTDALFPGFDGNAQAGVL
jgi:uncharacterized protein (DUF1501 family)